MTARISPPRFRGHVSFGWLLLRPPERPCRSYESRGSRADLWEPGGVRFLPAARQEFSAGAEAWVHRW